LSNWDFLVLLGLRPRLRALRSMDASQALRLAVFAFLLAFFLAVIHSIFKPMCAFLWDQPQLGPLLSARVLSLAFGLLFLLLLFSSLLAFLGRLLFSDDAPFFVASPMAPRDYFSLRLAQSAASAGWVIPLLWFPYLWALRAAVHGGFFFVAWGLLAPLPLAALATALGAGALCLLLRRLSPRRLRAGLFGAAMLALMAGLLALRFSRPERLADPQQARSVADYLAGLNSLEPWWWPGTWASRAVMLSLGRPLQALAWWLLSAAVAAAAWWTVLRSFGPHAFELWSKGQESEGGGQRLRSRRAFFSRGPRAAWRVLMERDALVLRRAPGQRLQAMLLGSLVILFAFSLGRLPLGGDQPLKDWLFLPVSGVAQVILVAVAARFVFPAGSLEKPGSWLLFHAPVAAMDHLRAKALLFSLLLVPLSLGLWLVVDHVFTPGPAALVLGFANFLMLPVTLACMNTGLGLAWAAPRTAHAEEVLASPAGVLVMVLGLLLVFAQNALMVWPLREVWYGPYRMHVTLLGLDLLLWASLHAAAALGPLALARRRIDGRI
jgi:ABC-2 type transport system permease protein